MVLVPTRALIQWRRRGRRKSRRALACLWQHLAYAKNGGPSTAFAVFDMEESDFDQWLGLTPHHTGDPIKGVVSTQRAHRPRDPDSASQPETLV